jgi:hypothetical protein
VDASKGAADRRGLAGGRLVSRIPKQTVLNLDTTDRKWMSRECVRHRKAVADYNDGERTRGVLGLADFAAPFVGTRRPCSTVGARIPTGRS